MRRHHRLGGIIAATLLLTATACGDDSSATTTSAPRVISGYQTDPPQNVAGNSLPEAGSGAEFDFVAQPGHLLVVYFGYTNCPDVCPTTLYDQKKALEQLGTDKAARIDMAMGTIDPDRDTDDVITGYLHSFIPAGHALRTTDQEALGVATKAFGASYSVTTTDDGVIEVSHSPFMYLVDENADVVLTWPFGLPSDAIAIDLDIMLGTIDGKA